MANADQVKEEFRKKGIDVAVDDNHVPAAADGTLPTHQLGHLAKSSGQDGDAGDWTENSDGTDYPEGASAAGVKTDAEKAEHEKSDSEKNAEAISDSLPVPEGK